jgi:hypothetical protein
MKRTFISFAAAATLALSASCSTAATRLRERPHVTAALTPDAREKIQRGIIEPGFTPEMVYLALGKPTSPTGVQVEGTRDGTWLYRDFSRNDRDFVRAGFRRRVVFDPVRRTDVVITEPVERGTFPSLEEKSLRVTFHDGRVVDIQRATL